MNLEARANALIARADIGRIVRVRLDKKTVVSGLLTKVEFGHIINTGMEQVVCFRVTLECGSNKTLRQFNLTRIPTTH